MTLRILWVTQDFPPDRGGVQTYSAELVRALVERGARVDVVAPAVAGAARFDARFACRVLRVACPRDAMPLGAIPRVLGTIARGSIDVVFCAQWNTAGPAALARARGSVGALAIAAHGRELLWSPAIAQTIYDRTRRRILAEADAVFAVSRFTADLVGHLGVESRRIHVVANGTDPVPFTRPSTIRRGAELRRAHGGPILLSVARLVPHKGIDTVMRAIARLRDPGGLRYVVVGDGPDGPRLRRLASELGIAERMVWRAAVDDAERDAWLHASDLFGLMSRQRGCDVEGFGIALLEAAACGRPALAGRSGGIADAVVDGVTGWLCAPDEPDDVATTLQALLDHPERLRAAGEAARTRLEHSLTWRHAAASIGSRLEALVAPENSAPSDVAAVT